MLLIGRANLPQIVITGHYQALFSSLGSLLIGLPAFNRSLWHPCLQITTSRRVETFTRDISRREVELAEAMSMALQKRKERTKKASGSNAENGRPVSPMEMSGSDSMDSLMGDMADNNKSELDKAM
eukprot:scaffold389816_cov34-Prasinocladus_malaysianus.AAC.1